MADPTLYFPDGVLYTVFEGGYVWKTVRKDSPSGRRSQARALGGEEGLRRFAFRLSSFLTDGSSTTQSTVRLDTFFEFLRDAKGPYRRFFFFSPKARDVILRIPMTIDADGVTVLNIFGGASLPYTLPVRGGTGVDTVLGPFFPTSPTSTEVFDARGETAPGNEWLAVELDGDGGTGEEWQITAIAGSTLQDAVTPGTHIFQMRFNQAHERIAARFESDIQPFSFDIPAADPPHEFTLSVIEAD